MSPLSTTLAFCTSAIVVLAQHFLRWHMSINEAKWTLMLSLCASRISSFLLLTSQIPCGNCLELFPFLVHGSLCIQNLHRLGTLGDKHMHQFIMCHRSESFPSNAIFMCFGLQRFCSLSRRLVGFHFSTKNCFELLFMTMCLLYILCHDARMLFVSLAGHGWSHRSFQFSSCVFDNF